MFVTSRLLRSTWFLLLAIVIAWHLPQAAYADVAPRWTDAQLVGFSDVIVRGRVTRVAVARDERVGGLYTYVTLDVADVLKGAVASRQVILKQLGGRLGSTALAIAGQPAFSVGEDVIVFLEVRPRDGTLTTTAMWQGKFTVVSDRSSGDVAVRQDPGGRARGVFGDQTRPLATWLPTLRRQNLQTSTATSPSIDVAPAEAARAVTDDGNGAALATWRDVTLERQAIRVDTVAPGQAQLAGGGEQEVRRAADFWTATGLTTLATGGLQPSGCFTTRDPDGRISIGPDTCGELNPRGGTVAMSGGWVQYAADAAGASAPRFLGAGVITNKGDMATRLLATSACFEQLARHELGHTLGLIDSPDGGGVMAPSLNCEIGGAAPGSDARPTFVPLNPGVSRRDSGGGRDGLYESIACAVGCRMTAADVITSFNGPTNLTYTLVGSTLTLTWTAPPAGEVLSYVVQAGSSPNGTDVADFSTGSTATTFSAAVGGNAVFYIRVRAAFTPAGISDPSNEIVVVIGNAAVPPGPPTDLTASVAGGTVTLAWSPPASGTVANYIIQAGSAPATSNLANFSTGSTATFFSAAGVPSGTYFVRVRASNASATSGASNEIAVIVDNVCVPPTAPSNLVASIVGRTVTLTWTAGTGAASYQLQVGSSPGGVDLVDRDLVSPATTLTAANVNAGNYYVRLRSTNACGQSAPSNEALIIIR